jgi:hypothetical protein
MPTPKSKKILHLPADSTPTPVTHHSSRVTSRKPRCDSPLNCLSEDRQAALMDFMRAHKLDETVEHLAAQGIKTNKSSLGAFRAACNTRVSATEANGAVRGLAESERPPLTGPELFERAQENYMAHAILNNDDKAWCRLHRARQQQERLQQNVEWRRLEERRVKLLEQRAAQTATPKQNLLSPLTPEEKDAHWRETFGVSPDYKLPGVAERQRQAREQREQKKQRRASDSSETAPAAAAPVQPAEQNPSNPTANADHEVPAAPATSAAVAPPSPSRFAGGSDKAEVAPSSAENPELKTVPQGGMTLKTPPSPPRSKSLDDMEETSEMLRAYGIFGDKCLVLAGDGLELYSNTNQFLPRPVLPYHSFSPDTVRQVIKDLRNGFL